MDLITFPILTIPTEIMSEIFLHCLPAESSKPQVPSASAAPMLLGAICREWRSIAHGDPRLWTALKITVWNSRRRTLLVHDWLLRAGSMPFSLSLIRPRSWDRCCCEPFFLHPPQGFSEEYCCCLSSSPFTHRWKHLTSFCGDRFTPTDCITFLLSVSPTLVRCEFHNINEDEEDGYDSASFPTVAHVLHLNLEYLALASDPDYEYNIGCVLILRSLNLPRLLTLELHCSSPPRRSSFLSFLTRAPGIQTFTARFDGPDGDELEDRLAASVLGTMPSVTTLRLRLDFAKVFFLILPLLTHSQMFLPHVHAITYSVFYDVYWQENFGHLLVNTLTSKWDATVGVAQLMDFEFSFTLSPYETPDVDDPAERLRELTENGMKIHVGPPDASWIRVCGQWHSYSPITTHDQYQRYIRSSRVEG